jgi:hypothetical protein
LKIDKHAKGIARRLDFIVNNDNNEVHRHHNRNNDNDDSTTVVLKDDDYYFDRGLRPPRFLYYWYVRLGRPAVNWMKEVAQSQYGIGIDKTITEDELSFYLKERLRDSTPEGRYQAEKREWHFHELSYYHQKEGGVDIIKEYGCGRDPVKIEGGWCVPECRYYHKEGRIEDEEVIQEHKEYIERCRGENRIVDPPDLSTPEAKAFFRSIKIWLDQI